ncbi:hypothetical protein B0H34DRAFT_664676 [Crassisporium funariophilum]|nr:hypothetical protein B0H34DRAFT_664676 [Crassisporium funariophilum]
MYSYKTPWAIDIPSDETLIGDSKMLLDASVSWQAGKTYQGVKTSQQQSFCPDTHSIQSWHCVVSEVHKDEFSFNKMWSKLGPNKVWIQKRYVREMVKVTRVKYISESQSIWTVLHTYPAPISPRVYTVMQASWLLEYSHRRRGITVTIPIDLSSKATRDLAELEEKGVRGLYISVEHVQELEHDMIEWRRLSCVNPGGLIPKFVAQKGIRYRMIDVSDFRTNRRRYSFSNLLGKPCLLEVDDQHHSRDTRCRYFSGRYFK